MSALGLSSRAIIGEFYKTLEANDGAGYVPDLSMLMTSDQDSETYKWLGQTPAMREWVGGRNAKGFRENGLTIANKHYEATLKVLLRELRRDKTGQVLVRIRELAQRTNSHWASLISSLMNAGDSTACYDGQYFFDTDHSEGDSGSQSNDISVDISALPAVAHGSTTAPSIEEAQQVVMQAVAQILGFVDDQGEPMNENAKSFLVVVSAPLYIPFSSAFSVPVGRQVAEQALVPSDLSIRVAMNARSTRTAAVEVYRTDGSVKPFIRQQETPVQLKAIAEGSEYEFLNDEHLYGVDTWRNVGYGYWQHACLATMT